MSARGGASACRSARRSTISASGESRRIPADARRPATTSRPARGLTGATTRTLPNGLTVVLLPLTSVPTLDVRLVFGAGTADEPAGKRGAAIVAAHALTWDLRFLNDMLRYAAAGGTNRVDVGFDHTSFATQGLDMHLDLLLAGLRRWVREGRYDQDADQIVEAMRRERKASSDDGALTDAWRTALYGGAHPYVQAGIVRHASAALTVDDAAQFRADHFTPDNATLVIAGGFDAAVADRWIDYLFADWTGRAPARRAPRATWRPRSIAQLDETTQLYLQLALPAAADRRAEQLVAAAMMFEVASDVRHQLGASYGLGAQLVESRLTSHYEIAGDVDAARAAEAVELLRARLESLRTDADLAARAFVVARARVLTQLGAVTGSAVQLAEGVQAELATGRAPLTVHETAARVQRLTIDAMAATLAVDLARAVVLMRGPAAALEAAFGVLGRRPDHVRADPAVPGTRAADPGSPASSSGARRSDADAIGRLEDALTEQGPPPRFTFTLAAGYAAGTVLRHGVGGLTLTGEVGYRLQRTTAVGLHLSLGQLHGTYDTGRFGPYIEDLRPVEVLPIGIGGYLQAIAYDRLWGAFLVGLHLDRVTDDGLTSWDRSLGIGVQGGVDILKLRGHRLGAFERIDGELLSDASYAAITFGLAYRR